MWVEAIDILFRIDPFEDRAFVDLRGEWQLDEDAVNPGIGVQAVDCRDERGCARIGGEPFDRSAHPGGLAGVLLVPDVDLAGGVVTDQHDRQAGDASRLGLPSRDVGGDVLADLLRDAFPSRSRAATGELRRGVGLSELLS